VALAGLAEPSFHMMYFLSLTKVRRVAGVTPDTVPPLEAAVVNTGVPKIIPVTERKV